MKVLVTAAAAMCLTAAANADTYVYSANLAGWGADGGGDASAVTPSVILEHTFALPDIASLDGISFALAHSFLSDLHIELITPTNQTIIIAQGDGPTGSLYQNTSDSSLLGDGGSDLDGLLTYNFVASGGDVWNNGLSSPSTQPAGNYNALNWANGSWAAGNWTIRLLDTWDTLDDGALGDVVVTYTTIPAPGALALLGLAGLVSTRRRRA